MTGSRKYAEIPRGDMPFTRDTQEAACAYPHIRHRVHFAYQGPRIELLQILRRIDQGNPSNSLTPTVSFRPPRALSFYPTLPPLPA